MRSIVLFDLLVCLNYIDTTCTSSLHKWLARMTQARPQYLCGDGVIKHEQLYTVIRPYFN